MKSIKKYVDAIEEELEGAKEYAECYVEEKVKDNRAKAEKYKEMAMDELKHASYVHEWAVEKIEQVSKVYTPPSEMLEVWEKSHREYVEKASWIKQMLSL